jgi:Heparinase II/III-like protein
LGKDGTLVSCSHNGYRRLKGKPIHRRTWVFSGSSLVVSDKIDGDFQHAIAYFHVHPSVTISALKTCGWMLQMPKGERVSLDVELGTPEWSRSHYASEFGRRHETQCLKVSLDKSGARIRLSWRPID